MSRRKAILLLLAFTVAILGYATWCARPFYVKPSIEVESGVPDELREAALYWWEENGGSAKPEQFQFRRYLFFLMHPYQTSPQPVRVSKPDDEEAALLGFSSKPRMNVRFLKDLEGPGWTPRITFPGPHVRSPPIKKNEWERIRKKSPIPGSLQG